jgi:hypothetical protein
VEKKQELQNAKTVVCLKRHILGTLEKENRGFKLPSDKGVRVDKCHEKREAAEIQRK